MAWEIVAVGAGSLLLVAGLTYWFYYVPVYNALVSLHEDVERAASNIEVLLQRRQDELNRLSIAVREATGHEASTLNEVISAREAMDAAGTPPDNVEQSVQNVLADVDARTEKYPEIAAIRNIDRLQENIVAIEQELAEQREEYNDIVTTYNKDVQTIPKSAVANIGGFEPRKQFEASEVQLAGEGIGLGPPAEQEARLQASGDQDRPLEEDVESERALDAPEDQEATESD